MAAIGDALANEYPLTNGGWKMRLVPIRDITGGDGFWVVITLFLFSIGLLIAIATANVSNLIMVARRGARARAGGAHRDGARRAAGCSGSSSSRASCSRGDRRAPVACRSRGRDCS